MRLYNSSSVRTKYYFITFYEGYLFLSSVAVMDILLIMKFGILLFIHVGLLYSLSKITSYYKEPFFLAKRIGPNIQGLSLILIILLGLIIIIISFFALEKSLLTFYVLNAAFLSIWFLELAIVTGKHFFEPLFRDDLPKEISIFVGFILAINGEYFTLMFIYRLFSSSAF